jgi:hypothetical protein
MTAVDLEQTDVELVLPAVYMQGYYCSIDLILRSTAVPGNLVHVPETGSGLEREREW